MFAFRWLLAALSFATAIAPRDSASAAIFLVPSATYQSDIYASLNVISLASVPAAGTVSWVQPSNSSQTAYDLTSAGLAVTFAHYYSTKGDRSYSNGQIGFQVTETSTYKITGSYSVDNIASQTSRFHLEASMQDRTNFPPATTLYNEQQESRSTTDASFTLGTPGGGGDYANSLVGNPTGVLQPGKTYSFFFYAFIQNYPETINPSATASGEVRLLVTPLAASAAVPEPTSLTLWGLGALGGAVGAYRRRKLAY